MRADNRTPRSTTSKRPALRIPPGVPTPPGPNDGSVAIVDGQVVIHDPGQGRKWPVLVPGDGVEVVVDGRLTTGPTAVSSDQRVEVRPGNQEPNEPRTYQIALSGDRSDVRVILGPGTCEQWVVPDHPPAHVLRLSARRQTMLRPSLDMGSLLAELQALNLAVAVDEADLHRRLADPGPAEVVVGRGEPPVPPVPGQITLKVDPATPTVEPGRLLAEYTPPLPGSPGQDVFGQMIDPGPAADPQLVAGPGASLIENGARCVAAIQGRPDVTSDDCGSVTIQVLPCLVFPGDVSSRNAPPAYEGDVVVMGSVRESVCLIATGHVEVAGSVEEATIEAGGRVVIERGCIRSTIRQGGSVALFRRALPLAEEIGELLEALGAAVRQLLEHPRTPNVAADATFAALVHVVTAHRFPRVGDLYQRLEEILAALPPPAASELSPMTRLLATLLRKDGFRTAAQLFEALNAWGNTMIPRLKAAASIPSPGNPVRIYYALRCEIHALSDVVLFGPGAEQTVIATQGAVEVSGHFRGGWIDAGGDVRLEQVGSPAGLRTLVSVPAGRSISARLVHPNAVFEIGGRVHQFLRQERYVTVGGKTAASGGQNGGELG